MSAPWLRNGSNGGTSAAANVWSEHIANDNRVYYWNSETRTASWEKPDALKTADELGGRKSAPADNDDWKEYATPEGNKYYHNHTTGVTTWDKPEALVRLEQEELKKSAGKATNGNTLQEDEIDEQAQQELERLDRINVVGADGKAISAAMYALSDEAVPTFKTAELAEEAFHKMLRKTGVQTDWTWDQTMRAAIKDPVWRAIPSALARKAAFEQYVVDLKKATIGKQKDRIDKLKQDFDRMLRRHDEIKHYSLWQNIKANLEGEVAYKAAIDEEERIAMFNIYVEKLEIEDRQAQKQKTQSARIAFANLLRELPIDLTTTWRSAHEQVEQSKWAAKDANFRSFSMVDMLLVFEQHVKELDRNRLSDLKVKKAITRQAERRHRKEFVLLLQELKASGQIYAGSTWKASLPLFKDRAEYLNLVGQAGSSPMDFFWDVCDELEQELQAKKSLIYNVLEAQKQNVELETTLEEFSAMLQQDDRTSGLSAQDLKSLHTSLQHRARQRAEDEKKAEERRIRRKQDDLRSAMKKLDPPIGIKDTYEDVRLRISMLAEFTALSDEEARQAAFNKYIRRLKERLEDEEARSLRRDRHSHRHSPTRDRRDRERRSSRESRRSGHDERDGRRHRDDRDRRGSFDYDPRSPKRSKHEYRNDNDRPKPVDEPMLDYGGEAENPSSLSDKGAGQPTIGAADVVNSKAVEDNASEDGEIAE